VVVTPATAGPDTPIPEPLEIPAASLSEAVVQMRRETTLLAAGCGGRGGGTDAYRPLRTQRNLCVVDTVKSVSMNARTSCIRNEDTGGPRAGAKMKGESLVADFRAVGAP
jgi:hypothetical protein